MYKISILTGQHLVSNPRVWKEANALSSLGHQVTVFTTFYSQINFEADICLLNKTIQYQSSCNLIPSFFRIPLIIYTKGLKKFANLMFRLFKITSIYQEVFLPKTQLSSIKRSKSDLFICHQETGLLLGVELIKMGFNVSFDFEDWYSEDYQNVNRPVSLLKNVEAYALKYGKYVTCPSMSMSSAIIKAYNTNLDVKVIYNSFPLKQLSNKSEEKILNSLVWFSQTIGPNRGIEEFLLASQKLFTPINIHFIGKCSTEFKNKMFGLLQGSPHTLVIHPLLQHDELIVFLQKFEIGLALETNCSQSRVHTITNKIITYLQLNLNVIASDTIGQLELQADFKESITYVSLNDPIDLVRKLQDALLYKNERNSLTLPYKYTWEAQQEKILSFVSNSICT